MRGFMIDCSRTIEQHGYYHELIDAIANWGGDTLLLHFCDDHGLGVALPGFEDLAHPWAMDLAALNALLDHADERGIEVIPEIECFGHCHYLLVRPELRAAFIGKPDARDLHFNAIDPANAQGWAVIQALLVATMESFRSRQVHIGCDEVELGGHCQGDPATAWSGHVNRLIATVCDAGRRPMLWADHLEAEPRILAAIDRRAAVVSWHYDAEVPEAQIRTLAAAGFAEVILAPAASCWGSVAHPSPRNLRNQRLMADLARELGAGYLSTVWCPYRHVQGAVWPALAAGLLRAVTGSEPTLQAVAEAVLGSGDPVYAQAIAVLAAIGCGNKITRAIDAGTVLDEEETRRAEAAIALGELHLPVWAAAPAPPRGDRWRAIQLAARCAVHLCRLAIDRHHLESAVGRAGHAILLKALREDWEATRFADDPTRHRARWDNAGFEHLHACFERWTSDLPAHRVAAGV